MPNSRKKQIALSLRFIVTFAVFGFKALMVGSFPFRAGWVMTKAGALSAGQQNGQKHAALRVVIHPLGLKVKVITVSGANQLSILFIPAPEVFRSQVRA